MSKRPHRSITQNGRARKRDRSIPGGNQKTLDRMNLRPCSGMMMMAQRRLDLAQRLRPLHLRLALPEHRKALATYSATGFYGGLDTL
jgi:hypothetical protein